MWTKGYWPDNYWTGQYWPAGSIVEPTTGRFIVDRILFQAILVDEVDYGTEPGAVNRAVTTGLTPLTIGSIETFELDAWKNGLPWDLTGGTVTLLLADPTGAVSQFTASINGTTASYNFQIPSTSSSVSSVGNWQRAWKVVDSAGITQVSQPIPFTVISSPV